MPSLDTEYAIKCKLKRVLHKNPIPSGRRPFEKIHFDLLEIKPYAKNSAQYVLVITNDFSQFNRFILLLNKYQAKKNLISFIREIKKTGNYPLHLHSDQGGEFSSTKFLTECGKLGISFECRPADSPQSNGIAERFNQSLLIKICCLLAQCSLPISFWDEAANHASTIMNLLPSRALNWKSSVFMHQNNKPKPLPPFKALLYLGYEKYSYAMRFFDPTSRKIVVSKDFSITQLTFEYGSKKVLKKDPITLPTSKISPLQHNPSDSLIIEALFTFTTTTLKRPNTSLAALSPLRPPATVEPDKDHPNSKIQSNQQEKTKKGYSYVPHYSTAPRNLESRISTTNIINKTNSNQQKNQNTAHLIDNSQPEGEAVMLNETIPISDALLNKEELQHGKNAIEEEFKFLTTKNTGMLVPPPKDEKIIGGMWCLVKKKNEFGEATRYKAQWVCFENYQENMNHYFDTYSSVARNKSLKILLSMAINRDMHKFQFDFETAFLYGVIDAPFYVSHVSNFKIPGKESWAWKLKKSLYGTGQTPCQWHSHLSSMLNNIGMYLCNSEESLFSNKEKTI
ncbi:hypothetical protein O181_038457 [Austropuccinia psidii MF-1]|uniref:Integrase catalytic domain-containing protein n=1 Tax=Austropuccinia psidii MF-1 TaxID=1389203 RepID=A0A9Q3DAZ2_9BASI|nr:hypothetical protein [Austropuccinia psidii MF-1]